jgi:hypothetical protein
MTFAMPDARQFAEPGALVLAQQDDVVQHKR